MTHEEAVSFIKNAVKGNQLQYWADLGCGNGTFTRALAELLPEGSPITAVDRERQRLDIDRVNFVRADFVKDNLQLEELDGILIANALHYVADKAALITRLEPQFSAQPCFIIIEYDTDRRNPWVPYPIPFDKLKLLFALLGYQRVSRVSERRSAYGSGNMYCALIQK
ncbi:class I SAM-dependent methyltransferase [Mucilaginibacter jinjuensis]|uniref:Class I SAM-dependent methyltransferase n=1 Tax=Mucilaginibacter jinjuensis TaxID=1176721 RepID=A0ABY7TCK2_9SPHI|nr:class I SAM-dependent methyltransferase [Mucilaginibacter jinjuensis]WCT14240.1 class I SAM-dependent methyltransferase [Mucilaginibacter jinjuensis]